MLSVLLWRSGRDSNPRTAFDRHTISSRARYDRFDTTPWYPLSLSLRNSSVIIHKMSPIVKCFCNYFLISAAQAFKTCAATGAAAVLNVAVPVAEQMHGGRARLRVVRIRSAVRRVKQARPGRPNSRR